MYEDVRYETEDGIATITIDRPETYNAFRGRTLEELNDAVRRATDDDAVYVVILTGAGDGFCAGADVTEMPDWSSLTKEEYAGYLWSVQNVVRQLRRTPKPTIAAVGGPAIGAGCDFALACDMRVMGEGGILREGFVNVGLVPGDGGAWLLPRLVGEAKAKELVMTGRDVGPEEAVDLGLAVEAVPSEEVRDRARDLANTLRDKPAVAMQETKALFDSTATYDDYAQAAIEGQRAARDDPEHTEAVSALREGRDPDFDRSY